MNSAELSDAWKDYFNWKEHVKKEKEQVDSDPDLFKSYENAAKAAKSLIIDFEDEPEESGVTIFITADDRYKIDAISNHDEFELHRDEYEPEDVVAICFFRNGEPLVKQMQKIY